jgi:hypothetical protein
VKGDEFRTRIAGRVWRVRFEPARVMGTDWGRCWLPAGRHPLIQVRRALRGQRALVALAACFTLLTVGSAFWLWYLTPEPTDRQIVSLTIYACFVLAINVIVRRK